MKIITTLLLLIFTFSTFSNVLDDETSTCEIEVQEIFKKFKPDFIELESKLALYKTAWTILVLNRERGEKISTMENEISILSKKISKAKDDPEFNQNYKDLLEYKPYVTRLEDREHSSLPKAIELVAKSVHTDEFRDLLFDKTQDKEKLKEEISKYAVDYETVKTSELLHDLYKKDKSKNSFLLKLTNQISSALRGRDNFKERDKSYFENIIENNEKLLSSLKGDLLSELKKACSNEDEVLNILNSSVVCKAPDATPLSSLDSLFNSLPVLDYINKDAELSYLKKEYLRVAPNKLACSLDISDKSALVDVSGFPKNNEYKLEINDSDTSLKIDIDSGAFHFEGNDDGTFLVYDKKSKKNYNISSESLKNLKVVSSWGNSSTKCSLKVIQPQKNKPRTNWVNQDVKIQKSKLKNLTSDEEKILAHEMKKGSGNFIIVDELKGVLKIIDHKGNLIKEIAIKEGFDRGDEVYGSLGNKTLGAGKYQVERTGQSSNSSPLDLIILKDARNQGISIRGNSSNCEKCIKIPDSEMKAILQSIKKSSNIYVLPENKKNNFTLTTHHDLFFSPDFSANEYNYNTSKSFDYHPSKYSLLKSTLPNPKDSWTKKIPLIGRKDVQIDTKVTHEFLKTLENEKYNLMKLYNLTNDEYNELVKVAFGILGNESFFGKPSTPRAMKEVIPAAVPVAKNYKSALKKDQSALDKLLEGEFKEAMSLEKEALGELWRGVKGSFSILKNSAKNYSPNMPLAPVTAIVIGANESVAKGEIDISENSRGLIQMKEVPSKIVSKYKIKKTDLSKPREAAISAIGFLAEAKSELKAKSKKYNEVVRTRRGPASGGPVLITNDNWTDYLHYIYMGSSREITNATATPEKNLYKKDIDYWNQALIVYETN